ncbi:RDD family protein [Cylindrospermum sp. FACHB-282]|uniref:RDD family protein n=1 Tax=Cylindrospermum sp. FACHB-282 TaxID=2692794 RepID=UPI0016837833|nr:RDD family protein [Cylindrospermum sp. FACHB-282]MBD2384470.1 RDD family protein [Cylindrospermum sp. FACHB-282]
MHLFNHVKFRTPESVELEFTLAGIGSRVFALIIDYLILLATLAVFFLIWAFVAAQLGDSLTEIFGSAVPLWLLAIAIVASTVIYAGYFVLFETLWQGQTPGKRIAKIRVIRDDGRPIGLQQASLRAVLRLFDESLFIGAFLIALSPQEKRLGDLAAGTIVIQTQTATKSAAFTISEQAKSLHIELRQTADLSLLLPDDFAIIREYLGRRSAMASKARALLSLKLSQQVQAIINLENLPVDVTSDVFLEAIYLAYQQPEY